MTPTKTTTTDIMFSQTLRKRKSSQLSSQIQALEMMTCTRRIALVCSRATETAMSQKRCLKAITKFWALQDLPTTLRSIRTRFGAKNKKPLRYWWSRKSKISLQAGQSSLTTGKPLLDQPPKPSYWWNPQLNAIMPSLSITVSRSLCRRSTSVWTRVAGSQKWKSSTTLKTIVSSWTLFQFQSRTKETRRMSNYSQTLTFQRLKMMMTHCVNLETSVKSI